MKAASLLVISLLLLVLWAPVAAAADGPLWTHTIGGTGVRSVAISGDGTTVSAAGEDGLVVLSADGVVQWSSPVRMYDVALPDGAEPVLAGGFDIQVYDADGTEYGGRKVFNVIRSIAVSPDGTTYVASTDGSTVVEGSLTEDTATERETGEDYFAVSLVPGTEYLAAGTESGSVILTSRGGGAAFWEYRASPKAVADIASSDGARTIVACTGDGMVHTLSRTGLLLWSAAVLRPEGVAVSRDGDRIAVCGAEGFALFDRTGTELVSVSLPAGCTGIALNGDATMAAVTTTSDVSLYALDGNCVAEGDVIPATGAGGTAVEVEQTPRASPATPEPPAGGEAATPTGQAAPAALVAAAGLIGTTPLLRRK
ncbi:hypothetical protein AZH53_08650 [Methanomicrobiaceae archaeon CYW5]|uniref:WD40 repeat domain-containing protein n=1 Tax=Methanovulcanius yangii TaxID=1789227 RepID=UPI0029CA2C7C|nr:PQQ-binding-like beta-propeller repeat protein [Methanovulcanius yangii]MBT8508473.1 hypothetical protein [Methanovulcanius yangii]